jgi:hemoglobin-like flavoprotein
MEVVMTSDDKLLVQHSWEQVLSLKAAAAELFYRKLFEMDPTLRTLFKGDLLLQGAKLTQMITAAVRGLDRLDALLPVVRDLGMRHGTYGVRDEHYGTVAAALLATLEQALGNEFTPEVKSAWIKTYGVLSQTMREAQLPPRAA